GTARAENVVVTNGGWIFVVERSDTESGRAEDDIVGDDGINVIAVRVNSGAAVFGDGVVDDPRTARARRDQPIDAVAGVSHNDVLDDVCIRLVHHVHAVANVSLDQIVLNGRRAGGEHDDPSVIGAN